MMDVKKLTPEKKFEVGRQFCLKKNAKLRERSCYLLIIYIDKHPRE